MNEPRIIYDHLEPGLLGQTDGQRYIWIDRRQSAASMRETLDHELAHFLHGDAGHQAPKVEARIEAAVAQGIIHLEDLAWAAAWSEHVCVVAEELAVRPQTVELRLQLLTDEERDRLAERLAEAHWAD
ncbi:ImmA/IrrE family metallo-endopeptidase [Brachybacterium phenoliresistens]|uniref:ImmA/IrrE family metallo-endopeptidase n=1 Tax=Brachybacterium phenoliresistens TaxID=396014 RepID=UPI0031E2C921